jgi:threonine dehydratase
VTSKIQTHDIAKPTLSAGSDGRLSLQRIQDATKLIDPLFLNSPQFVCEPLSAALEARVLVKVETLNPIRCFKGRGASFFASGLRSGERIVTASAGNLGQALAYSCRSKGVALTVFAALGANPLKVTRMREFGAEVVLGGEDFDAAKARARLFAAERGLPMVEDGREPALSEGAGTIAVELLSAPERLDVILVALGNGAILGGMARWCQAYAPEIEVIGVAAAGAPCMERSWRSGVPVETARIDTIADGIGTRVPVPEALGDLSGTISDVVLVEDAAMVEGMRLVHRHLGLVLEPSGAAGIAAILSDRTRFRGRSVATVLCGGNLTDEQVRRWLT